MGTPFPHVPTLLHSCFCFSWEFGNVCHLKGIWGKSSNSFWKEKSPNCSAMLVINQCCQPCGFPANLVLFFCGVAVIFYDLRVACFWACFNWNLLVFGLVFMQISVLWIAFFQILWHFFCFNLLLKKIWACFCENMLILSFYFRVCLPVFLFNFPTDFLFCWIFLANACWACFWLNYLFWACFTNLLAYFCEITWHLCNQPFNKLNISEIFLLLFSLTASENG